MRPRGPGLVRVIRAASVAVAVLAAACSSPTTEVAATSTTALPGTTARAQPTTTGAPSGATVEATTTEAPATTAPGATASTTTAPAATTTTSAVTATGVPSTTTVPSPTWIGGTPEVTCRDLPTHRTCVVDGMPVVTGPVEQWGEIVPWSPEAFCTVDLHPTVCREVARTLAVGAAEWGNYGPVEYWVVGLDRDAVDDLTEVMCQRRDDWGQGMFDRCMSRHATEGFSWYHRVGVEADASGRPAGSMGHNGNRGWNVHFYTSSPPWGFTDRFRSSGAGDQVTVLHEYFHAVQHSSLLTEDHEARYRGGMGPVWFVEGGADWMGLAAYDRTRASGVLPEVNVEDRWDFSFEGEMRQRMEMGLAARDGCPDVSLGDVGYGQDCSDLAFGFGPWAHAWLAHRFGADSLLDDLHPVLEDLGWEGAFAHAYGMTPDEFYEELDGFLALDIEEQLAILPGGGEVVAPPTTTAAPARTVPLTTTEVSTSTLGTEVACADRDAHRYCVAAGAPVAPIGIDVYGRKVGYTPEVFCAVDVPDLACTEVTRTLLIAMAEWGAYGPLEYWIQGLDEAAALDLIGVNCDRRAERGHRNRDDCLADHVERDHGMLSYQRIGVGAIEAGRPRGNAGHNGGRQWNMHFFTSSLPWGFTDRFEVSGASGQRTVLHEYFHAVQHAHLMTTDHELRYQGGALGPTWFGEGGAEWMAQATLDRLRTEGTMPEVNVEGRWEFVFEDKMRRKMTKGLDDIADCPGDQLHDWGYDHCRTGAYDLGAWAHAWLSHRFGPDVLLDVLYPVLDAMGWDAAFEHAYGLTPAEFSDEFDGFLAWDLDDQMAILP